MKGFSVKLEKQKLVSFHHGNLFSTWNACSKSTLSSTLHSSGNGVKFARSWIALEREYIKLYALLKLFCYSPVQVMFVPEQHSQGLLGIVAILFLCNLDELVH